MGRWRLSRLVIAAVAAAGAALGGLVTFFLDPDRGRGRRSQTADRLAGLRRRSLRRFGRVARYAASTVGSLGERITHRTLIYRPPNDATLAAKVESELFRDSSIPKGRMNINVENGVVVLRGVADSNAQVERIVAATQAIAGVRSVRSLLRSSDEVPPDELVGGSTKAPATRGGARQPRAAVTDPGTYVGRLPERARDSIPGGISRKDRRVAAVDTQPGAHVPEPETPTGHRSGEPATDDSVREAGQNR